MVEGRKGGKEHGGGRRGGRDRRYIVVGGMHGRGEERDRKARSEGWEERNEWKCIVEGE